MRTMQLGLVGFGTVGTGVARLLIDNAAIIQSRTGAKLGLKSIADIDIETDRGIALPDGLLTTDVEAVINDPDIDIVIEMIGGETIAKEIMLRAIAKGKHIVTANKALLAKHGNQLFRAAADHGVEIAFEASVGGCMPVIKTIRESMVANHIQSMVGILNGTCNYILSNITDAGSTFQAALAEAQANGCAEADPTLDIEGYDTAHKLAIITALAYGMEINFDDIYIEGITGITPMDIEYARQFGYKIKLLAIGKRNANAVEARVHPTMIPVDNILSSVNGTLNALTITGDATGDTLLYGHGAGMLPTASAVISDIVDISRNLLSGAGSRVPMLSYPFDRIQPLPIMPIDDITTHYYIRFSALDRPGVLSIISGILGKFNISIQSVHQKGRRSNGSVPIVMLTHRAREKHIKHAVDQIVQQDVITAAPMLIRIEDNQRSS